MTPEARLWSQALRRRLDAWGWTQRQLADHLGVDYRRVCDWVKGRRVPRDKAAIVRALAIDPAEVAPDWLRDVAHQMVPPAPAAPIQGEAA